MDTMNATCPTGHVMLIHDARFGRMALGRCVKQNLGYLGCEADAIPVLDKYCTGKRKCTVPVPNPYLHVLKPCPEDTTPYLLSSHYCVPGKHV